MFVHDFAYVDAPAAAVQVRLLSAAFAGLDRAAAEAYADGEALLGRVGPVGGLSKLVTLTLLEPYRRADALVVPLTWTATGPTSLFPRMHASLVVAPVGEHHTSISLEGSYDPPLGEFGRRLDRLVLHRVAEATVRSLLRRLAESLAEEPAFAASPRPGPHPEPSGA